MSDPKKALVAERIAYQNNGSRITVATCTHTSGITVKDHKVSEKEIAAVCRADLQMLEQLEALME